VAIPGGRLGSNLPNSDYLIVAFIRRFDDCSVKIELPSKCVLQLVTFRLILLLPEEDQDQGFNSKHAKGGTLTIPVL
jgi:hypothetical protein